MTRFEGSMDCVAQFVEEDVVVFGDKDDDFVGLVCSAVDARGESLVLDLHAELLGDLHEGTRGFFGS